MHEIRRLRTREADGLIMPLEGDAPGTPGADLSIVDEQIETIMRLHQLAARERTKTIVMFAACQPGTEVLGFWSDD